MGRRWVRDAQTMGKSCLRIYTAEEHLPRERNPRSKRSTMFASTLFHTGRCGATCNGPTGQIRKAAKLRQRIDEASPGLASCAANLDRLHLYVRIESSRHLSSLWWFASFFLLPQRTHCDCSHVPTHYALVAELASHDATPLGSKLFAAHPISSIYA